MSDGHIILDDGGTNLVGHVYHGTVLHIHTVAHGDRSHVATHYSVEPHTTLVAHGDFAHDGGILTEITFLSPFRFQAID